MVSREGLRYDTLDVLTLQLLCDLPYWLRPSTKMLRPLLQPRPQKSIGFTDIVATLRPSGGITAFSSLLDVSMFNVQCFQPSLPFVLPRLPLGPLLPALSD